MLKELERQLASFVREHVGEDATVARVTQTAGHAGFSYFFSVEAPSFAKDYVLRLPPEGARYVGTADVLRMARVTHAIRDTTVPVAPVAWSGADERWFGRPYFIAERLVGDTLRAEEYPDVSEHELVGMTREAMVALAELHKLDWTQYVPDDGPPGKLEDEVHSWDKFATRAAEPQMMELQPTVKSMLLEQLPTGHDIGICHGDSQWTNFLYKPDRGLAAIVDWELWSVGATPNDLGWMCTFADEKAWAEDGVPRMATPPPEAVLEDYAEAFGRLPDDMDWFRAFASYRFAVITGLNLSLHRRGKRVDPMWEDLKSSANTLLQRSHELLT